MITKTQQDSILDQLVAKESISHYENILETAPVSVIGSVSIKHWFGKVEEFQVSINDDDIQDTVTEAVQEHKNTEEDIDFLGFVRLDDSDVFLIPVSDTSVQCWMAVVQFGEGLSYNKGDLEDIISQPVPESQSQSRGYDPGRVNNLVKMVNSGEDIDDQVDGLDDEDDEEVLSFREF